MDFTLSTEARELAGLTRDLAASGRPLWPALAEAGVLSAALPKRVGGEGYGLLEQCAILVELGRAAATVPYLLRELIRPAPARRTAGPVTGGQHSGGSRVDRAQRL